MGQIKPILNNGDINASPNTCGVLHCFKSWHCYTLSLSDTTYVDFELLVLEIEFFPKCVNIFQ